MQGSSESKTLIDIRPLQIEDALKYRELRLEALLDSPASFGSSHEEESLHEIDFFTMRITPTNTKTVYGAFDGGQLVGATGVRIAEGLKERHKASIWGVYVKASHRSLGLGRRLVEAAIGFAKSGEGVRQVLLSANASNSNALALYESLGFVAYGVEPASLKVSGEYHDEKHLILIF